MAAADHSGTGQDLKAARRPLPKAGQLRVGPVLVLLVTLIVLFEFVHPAFLSPDNVRAILLSVTLLLIVATGQTAVMLTRNFDLSVGSVVGLSAMTTGVVLRDHPTMPPLAAFGLACLVGVTAGLANGLLITFLRVPSIIITLGMLSVLRGVVFVVAGGFQIDPNDVPSSFVDLSITSPIGVPYIVIIALVVLALVAMVLRWTRSGRTMYAVGSNPDAAALRGLPSRRTLIIVFALSGAAAGLGGAIFLSQYGLVQVNAGTGLEFLSITAVVIGGTSVFGGSGGVLGTALGCLLLGCIGSGLAISGASGFWQDTVYGLLLVTAVVGDAVVSHVRASRALVRPELAL
jgi:rhamnose transport system permease protein